jgi:hypothetical protein
MIGFRLRKPARGPGLYQIQKLLEPVESQKLFFHWEDAKSGFKFPLFFQL